MTEPCDPPYEFCARSDRGRVRANNEDAVAIDAASRLMVLADGMGGYQGGEVASEIATTLIRLDMAEWLAQHGQNATALEVQNALQHAIHRANQAILEAASSSPEYAGMGTTLVAVVFHSGLAIVAHIGDSRCYRLRAGGIEQITRDHSWLQEQIDAGLMSEEEAAHSSYRNLVTRALGVDMEMDVEVHQHQVESNDLYLVCSDGLTDMLDDASLHALASGPGALSAKTTRLIDAANAQGGRDNVSVILAQAGGVPRRARRNFIARLLTS